MALVGITAKQATFFKLNSVLKANNAQNHKDADYAHRLVSVTNVSQISTVNQNANIPKFYQRTSSYSG